MKYEVVFHKAARQDIDDLLTHLAPKTGTDIANRFVDRIIDYCLGFETFPERGTRNDDIEPGLRMVGWRSDAPDEDS